MIARAAFESLASEHLETKHKRNHTNHFVHSTAYNTIQRATKHNQASPVSFSVLPLMVTRRVLGTAVPLPQLLLLIANWFGTRRQHHCRLFLRPSDKVMKQESTREMEPPFYTLARCREAHIILKIMEHLVFVYETCPTRICLKLLLVGVVAVAFAINFSATSVAVCL